MHQVASGEALRQAARGPKRNEEGENKEIDQPLLDQTGIGKDEERRGRGRVNGSCDEAVPHWLLMFNGGFGPGR